MRWVITAAMLAALAACSKAPPPAKPVETAIPEEFRGAATQPAAPAGPSIGTPMKDRVATIGLLNKRNNISQDLTLKPGETRRIGDVIVTLKACERTAPWEMPQETGAFVQIFVQQARGEKGFAKVFSGWLFKESPSLNVVEHPIYDVWVKDCAMSFPGEEGVAPADKPKPTPVPKQSPAPTQSPAPAPEAANDATA